MGNTEWGNSQALYLVENIKVGGTSADLVEDHMLGQYFFDYSWTKLIKRIKVTADANLVKKHYENHQWEDQSKHASHFIYYNFYKVHANVATPFDLQSQKTRPFGMHF